MRDISIGEHVCIFSLQGNLKECDLCLIVILEQISSTKCNVSSALMINVVATVGLRHYELVFFFYEYDDIIILPKFIN